jgi:hypothetical protein
MGIDPGIKGACAIVTDDGVLVRCFVFPSVKELSKSGRKLSVTDINALSKGLSELKKFELSAIAIEEPLLMPGQHVSSTFNNGKSHGIILALLAIHFPEHKLKLVKCKDWQDEMITERTFVASKLRRHRRKQLKADSVKVAQELYPSFDFKKSKKSKVESDGMADAVLIATYCYKIYGEESN